MKSVTIEQVLSWQPCYIEDDCDVGRDKIIELFAGRETLTIWDILELDIPDEEKLWAVLREELLPTKLLHVFACDVAEIALLREREEGRDPDEISWKIIEVKRRWIDGKATDEELKTVRIEADAAVMEVAWGEGTVAEAAARTAARTAAGVAVRTAARAAAWAAAEAAVRTAAGASARTVAARAAAREEQIKHLKTLIQRWDIE